MSILNIENLSFSFGDKTIFKNMSLRLLKGEHAGLVGVNHKRNFKGSLYKSL